MPFSLLSVKIHTYDHNTQCRGKRSQVQDQSSIHQDSIIKSKNFKKPFTKEKKGYLFLTCITLSENLGNELSSLSTLVPNIISVTKILNPHWSIISMTLHCCMHSLFPWRYCSKVIELPIALINSFFPNRKKEVKLDTYKYIVCYVIAKTDSKYKYY